MNVSSSYSSKKRKTNNDSATIGDELFRQQSLSYMERMEKMMTRMEEKLDKMSNLESRCEKLEAKCSSLESKLESKCNSLENTSSDSQSVKEYVSKLEEKIDSFQTRAEKLHEYNKMLLKNQRWNYPKETAPHNSWSLYGYESGEVRQIENAFAALRDKTIKLRQGEWPDENDVYDDDINKRKGVKLCASPIYDENINHAMLVHWKEFAAALKQFTPAMNLLADDCECFFVLEEVQLNYDAVPLIKEALIGKPFRKMRFCHSDTTEDCLGGMTIEAILEIAESNKHLRKLEILRNQIHSDNIERLCSVIYNNPIVHLDLSWSFDPGVGDELLRSLLTSGELKLKSFRLTGVSLTSEGIMLLADFLATNPSLKYLFLGGNELNDDKLSFIANALRTNTTLRFLLFQGSNEFITASGFDSFGRVFYDGSSLNSAANSNHCCFLHDHMEYLDSNPNFSNCMRDNRGRKIYCLLSSRHKTMSNVQHLDDLSVKVVPNIIEAVQNYGKIVDENVHNGGICVDDPSQVIVRSLSLVFEIMKWHKVIDLYES